MVDQLMERNCMASGHRNIYPITSIGNVIDPETGKPLTDILNQENHLYLPFKNNTKKDTRLQVPFSMRRKGLWISYVTCRGNVVTEWYNSDATDNNSWGDGVNWIPYLSKDAVASMVKNVLSWYKA